MMATGMLSLMLLAESGDVLSALLYSVLFGLIVAAVIVGGMISKLKTVRAKREANDYVKPNSLHLTVRTDQFLYKRIERKPRSQQNK